MKQKEIKVLMVAPGECPREVVLKNNLDALQKAVSIGCDYQGLIEVISLEKGACIICNEEGKLLGLDGNRRQGVNVKVAQARWGQKDITTAMNIYSHVLPSSAREALDKIG